MAKDEHQPKLELNVEIPTYARAGLAAQVMEEFLASGAKTAKVTDHSQSFEISLRRFVRETKSPVKVQIRGGEIYLNRTD